MFFFTQLACTTTEQPKGEQKEERESLPASKTPQSMHKMIHKFLSIFIEREHRRLALEGNVAGRLV